MARTCLTSAPNRRAPGAIPVSAADEEARLIPVVRAVRARLPDVVISIDTYKPDIFRAAHAARAGICSTSCALSMTRCLKRPVDCAAPLVITHAGAQSENADTIVDEVLSGSCKRCETRADGGYRP